MDEYYGRRIDVNVVQTVQACAQACVDDLLSKLAAHHSMAPLQQRRQELIERTTSALLRIVADESQAPTNGRGE